MNQVEIQNREEIDRDILYYVREMQRLAQVQAGSVLGFLKVQRRRQLALRDVEDRLAYLVSAGYLAKNREWHGGEYFHFTITADGMDVLDGVKPPRGWAPRSGGG